jgi:hypothetical protein
VTVRVEDLAGRAMLVTDDLCSPIDMTLPAGTYHVNLRVDEQHRRYTIALERDTTFHLRLPAQRDPPRRGPAHAGPP